MSWQTQLKGDPLPWLLSEERPGIRYLALRELCDIGPDEPEMCAARKAAHREGPIADILREMNEAGYWVQPGAGYAPKYHGTVWSIILLAQLGARLEEDARIGTPAPTFSIMPWRAAGSSATTGRHPVQSSACKATSARRWWNWAAMTPGSMRRSSGWREA
jgi:hypothetical protein